MYHDTMSGKEGVVEYRTGIISLDYYVRLIHHRQPAWDSEQQRLATAAGVGRRPLLQAWGMSLDMGDPSVTEELCDKVLLYPTTIMDYEVQKMSGAMSLGERTALVYSYLNTLKLDRTRCVFLNLDLGRWYVTGEKTLRPTRQLLLKLNGRVPNLLVTTSLPTATLVQAVTTTVPLLIVVVMGGDSNTVFIARNGRIKICGFPGRLGSEAPNLPVSLERAVVERLDVPPHFKTSADLYTCMLMLLWAVATGYDQTISLAYLVAERIPPKGAAFARRWVKEASRAITAAPPLPLGNAPPAPGQAVGDPPGRALPIQPRGPALGHPTVAGDPRDIGRAAGSPTILFVGPPRPLEADAPQHVFPANRLHKKSTRVIAEHRSFQASNTMIPDEAYPWRGLTIDQPSASLIVDDALPGHPRKWMENRDLGRVKQIRPGSWLIIHASGKLVPYSKMRQQVPIPPEYNRRKRTFPTHAILGVAHVEKIIGLDEARRDPDLRPYATGPYCIVFDTVVRLNHPVTKVPGGQYLISFLSTEPLDPKRTPESRAQTMKQRAGGAELMRRLRRGEFTVISRH